MAVTELSNDAVRTMLDTAKTIAVVGLSDDPMKPSYGVAAYMQRAGYRIIPITPKGGTILGEQSYPDLAAVPVPIDIVDIFRRPDMVGPHIDEAIAVGAKAVWLQLGIRNDTELAKAQAAGLEAVQDKCIKIEHAHLLGRR